MNQETEIIIEPKSSALHFSLREVVEKLDMAYLIVHRDFTSQFKQTILGPIWLILSPLMNTTVFVLVFSRIGGISTNSRPPFLFYLCGITAWNYFGGVFNKTSDVFVANAGVFGKVYFPRILVPIAGLFSISLNSLIQFIVLFLFTLFAALTTADITFGFKILWLIPAILQLAVLGLGCGLFCSALTAKYRDLGFLVGAIMSIWFYCSPILYPVSQVPAEWLSLYMMNPTAAPLELIKYGLLGGSEIDLKFFLLSSFISVCIFSVGFVFFQKSEKSFIDTV